MCRLEYLRVTLYQDYLALPVDSGGLSHCEAFCQLFRAMVQCDGGASWSEGLQLLQVPFGDNLRNDS